MKNISSYQNKQVLVIGMGKSGVNSAKLLVKLGAQVIVNDKTDQPNQSQVDELKKIGVKVVTGSHPLELLDGTTTVVKNPVVPYDNLLVAKAIEEKIPVITEPELAYQVLDATMIGITGTNGKTTTTTMITEMLNRNRSKGKAYAAGNIGIPTTQIAQQATADDVMVTELSSFQLMGIKTLHPHIAVLTNIYEAHTDWHGSHANYVNAKMRILMNQTADDYFVVNWDNEEARQFSKHTQATVVPFSREDQTEAGAYEKDGVLYFKGEKIIDADQIGVPGSHNVENALAAIAAAKLMGQSAENIKEVLQQFTGVRHRMQYVTTFNERKFYNDSKATDIEATQKALDGFNQPVVLLAGGLDRGFNKFDRLVPYFKKHVRALVVFGETADLMADAGKQAGIKEIVKTENAVTAVPEAYRLSKPGDVILLSPACASWDQWPTFEVRGDQYIKAVEDLIKKMEEAK
ncbi:UDP-N-acetylmuramoyl-L-alanine--D-glutamate ligase [Ligilactobacillus aviarius]|uniref:UDP-N-acetylmuramoyl-L-alanine--D-glutamate ligase n=1 Tax=Ligilactobacillus aviarius TaxID=1606 RepID=UPI0024BB44C5|nr:UDP-N-acetylmuramoyl-L-alanine--D-glutamate ligase [Ligilactobacillus aviarius]